MLLHILHSLADSLYSTPSMLKYLVPFLHR